MAYIDNAFVKKYYDAVILALQQKGSRLKNYVVQDVLEGEEGFFDFLSKDDDIATVGTDYAGSDPLHPDTVITDPTWTRRKISGDFLTKAYLVEKRDVIKLLRDPTSKYIQSIAYAMGRKIDKIIINAATGTAYTGKDGTVAVTLPSEQIVAHDDKALTFEKLMQAKELMDKADIDPEEPKYIILPAGQVYALLKDLLTTNLTRDAETVRAIVQGQINTYMGFQFLMTNLTNTETLTLGDSSTTTGDDVFCYSQEGLLLAINKQAEASIDKRPDKNNAMQVFFGMYAGATRMDEERVVKIPCVQSA